MDDIRKILKKRTDDYLERLKQKEGLKRTFTGVWIPKIIWEGTLLSTTEKVLLAEIDSLDNGDGCFASNDYLSTFLCITERQLQKKISRLTKLGLVRQVKFDGRKRWLKTNIALCVKKNRGEQNATSAPNKTPPIDNS